MPDAKDRRAATIAALTAALSADDSDTALRWFTAELAERGFVVADAARYEHLQDTELQAAEQGNRLMRARWALALIRNWCISAERFHAGVRLQMCDWIDAGGPAHPVPWPDSPFVAEWARSQGWSDCKGHVGLRFTVQLVQRPDA